MISKNKILQISCLFFIFFSFLSHSARAGNHDFSPFIESFPSGKIDWDNGFFYGTGTGYPHKNSGSRARALKVAQAGALSAILQVASRLRVDDRHTLSELEKGRVIIQLKGLIYYEPHERLFIKEGDRPYYRVTYRAPLKGVKGLTRKLLPFMRSHPPDRPELPEQQPFDDSDEQSPWLVLDARGITHGTGVQPAIFPRIVTEEGKIVYDLSTAEEGALVKRGMARYVVSEKEPGELGYRPGKGLLPGLIELFSPQMARAEERRKRRGKYIIKNVKDAQGIMKANLVISAGDAQDIREEDASSQILRKCRVIVILSGSLGGIEGKREGIKITRSREGAFRLHYR